MKTLLNGITLFGLFVISLYSSAMQAAVFYKQHFAHMPFRETPFADLKGIYPISAKLAHTYKHFEITYDQQLRPVEIKFKQGDTLVPLNISRNALTFASHIKIEYQKNKETRTFIDIQDNPTLSNGAYKEVFDLDENSNRTKLRFYDFHSQQIENQWGIFEYNWEIDRTGTVTETRFNKQG